jgi:hypothetical protein
VASAIERLGIHVEDDANISLLDAQRLDDAAAESVTLPFEGSEEDKPLTVSNPVAPPKSPLRSAMLFEKPRFSETPAVNSPAIPSEESSLPFQEVSFTVPQAGERPARREKQHISPSVKKYGSALAKKLPGAERIIIRMRNAQNGSLGYIGDYQARDLLACNDIESFLNRYVKPHHGAGEFQITVVDAAGNEQVLAPVTLLEPRQQSQENGTLGLIRELVEHVKTGQTAAAQAPLNPVTMLRETIAVQKELAPPPAAPPPPPPDVMGPLAAMISAQSQQTMAMMQMMQAQSQQAAAQAQASNQQTMQMFMQMMTAQNASSSKGGDPLPPMPASPPSMFEGLTLEKIVALAPIVKEIFARPEDGTKEILLSMLAKSDKEKLTPKDTIDLMNAMRPAASGTDDFRKALENLSLITQVAQNLRPQEQPGATLVDVIGSIFANGDFVSSIGTAIRKRAESAAMTSEVKARQALAETSMRMGYRPPQTLPAPQAPAQAQVPAQTAQPARTVAQNGAAPAAASPAQASAQPPKMQFPPLPERIGDHLQAIADAADEPLKVEKTFELMMYLAGFAEWRGFVNGLLEAAKRGDKKTALTLFANFCKHLHSMNVLDAAQTEKLFTPIENNFDAIIAHLNGTPVPEVVEPPDPNVDPFGAALHEAEHPEEYEEGEEGEDEEGEEGEDDEEGDEDESGEDEDEEIDETATS